MKDAFDYSIVLLGYHSARQSFLSGTVAVRRDSSLPTNLMSFTYGAEASLSLVENAKPLALLIGGRVRNLNAHVQPQIQKTNFSVQLINSKLVTDDFTWPDQVFKNADGTPSLGAEQKSYLPTSRTTELFLGFDYESVINNKNIEQVIITSYRMVQGKPEYAKKVIHHSNFMANKGEAEHTLPTGSSKIVEHGAKTIHYMPEATQLTDFYNHKNQNGDFFAPRGIPVMHSGLDVDGSLHLDSDEISKENNIISYDDVFGTIFATKASVVLSGANVYGQIFTVDYHQRGNNTHVFIPNTWLSSMIPPQTDNLHTIQIQKVDASNPLIKLQGAQFVLTKNDEHGDNYYTILNQAVKWVKSTTSPADAIVETNEKGKAVFIGVEPNQDYQVQEVKAPQGYELLRKPVSIVVEDGVTSGDTSFVFKNTKQVDPTECYDLLLVKRDAQTYKTLKGAEFRLYRIHEGQKSIINRMAHCPKMS
ncbi:prealbumin-like fold domain-containing protein [Erysipelothrix rhusiopathiae]|nr:prealbumin-like fold domain-containing protein [Erysipelothrix rhusiopathiae]